MNLGEMLREFDVELEDEVPAAPEPVAVPEPVPA